MTISTTEDLVRHINAQFEAIKTRDTEAATAAQTVSSRLLALEQKLTSNDHAGGDFGTVRAKSWGGQFVASAGYKSFTGDMAHRGTIRVPMEASITIASGAFDSLAPPDRQREIVGLGRIRPTVRSLLAPGRTGSDLVQFPRLVERTNRAAPVAPGEQKPQSDYEFTVAEAPVRTIAHWVPITRQMADDTPGLMSLIDGELRYGLQRAEEDQLLYGDGVGENIAGLIPQATPYSPPFEVQQKNQLDELLLAIAQAQESQIPATGIIVNDLDWKQMQALKDGEGRYLGAGPFGTVANLAWTLPVIDTPAMEPGEFLVGGFGLAAQILDRMDVEVLISSEDRDNFIKNMLTIRGEERLALAVKRPQALVHGTFETPSG